MAKLSRTPIAQHAQADKPDRLRTPLRVLAIIGWAITAYCIGVLIVVSSATHHTPTPKPGVDLINTCTLPSWAEHLCKGDQP